MKSSTAAAPPATRLVAVAERIAQVVDDRELAVALSAQAAGTRAAEAELGLPGLDVQVHPWWPLVVVFGLLAVGCGLLVVLRGRAWPSLGSKYERRESEGTAHQRTPAQAWDALDRGLDPTIDSDLTQ